MARDIQHLTNTNLERVSKIDTQLAEVYDELSKISVRDQDLDTEAWLYLAKQNINRARRALLILKDFNDC